MQHLQNAIFIQTNNNILSINCIMESIPLSDLINPDKYKKRGMQNK